MQAVSKGHGPLRKYQQSINTRHKQTPFHLKDLTKERQESSNSTRGKDSSLQTSVTALFENSRMFDRNSREHKELTKLMTMCLAKDMLPLSTVD